MELDPDDRQSSSSAEFVCGLDRQGGPLPFMFLQRIQRMKGNDVCFDCGSMDPDWASVSHGTLVCLRCAGRHRTLGVHVSRIKSLTMDAWEPHQVAAMLLSGNKQVKDFFTKSNIQNSPLEDLYRHTRAAEFYRKKLHEQVELSNEKMESGLPCVLDEMPPPSEPGSPTVASPRRRPERHNSGSYGSDNGSVSSSSSSSSSTSERGGCGSFDSSQQQAAAHQQVAAHHQQQQQAEHFEAVIPTQDLGLALTREVTPFGHLARVSVVHLSGSAMSAGIVRGDYVVGAGGRMIRDYDELMRALPRLDARPLHLTLKRPPELVTSVGHAPLQDPAAVSRLYRTAGNDNTTAAAAAAAAAGAASSYSAPAGYEQPQPQPRQPLSHLVVPKVQRPPGAKPRPSSHSYPRAAPAHIPGAGTPFLSPNHSNDSSANNSAVSSLAPSPLASPLTGGGENGGRKTAATAAASTATASFLSSPTGSVSPSDLAAALQSVEEEARLSEGGGSSAWGGYDGGDDDEYGEGPEHEDEQADASAGAVDDEEGSDDDQCPFRVGQAVYVLQVPSSDHSMSPSPPPPPLPPPPPPPPPQKDGSTTPDLAALSSSSSEVEVGGEKAMLGVFGSSDSSDGDGNGSIGAAATPSTEAVGNGETVEKEASGAEEEAAEAEEETKRVGSEAASVEARFKLEAAEYERVKNAAAQISLENSDNKAASVDSAAAAAPGGGGVGGVGGGSRRVWRWARVVKVQRLNNGTATSTAATTEAAATTAADTGNKGTTAEQSRPPSPLPEGDEGSGEEAAAAEVTVTAAAGPGKEALPLTWALTVRFASPPSSPPSSSSPGMAVEEECVSLARVKPALRVRGKGRPGAEEDEALGQPLLSVSTYDGVEGGDEEGGGSEEPSWLSTTDEACLGSSSDRSLSLVGENGNGGEDGDEDGAGEATVPEWLRQDPEAPRGGTASTGSGAGAGGGCGGGGGGGMEEEETKKMRTGGVVPMKVLKYGDEFEVVFSAARMGFRMQKDPATGHATVAHVVPYEAAALNGLKAGDLVLGMEGVAMPHYDTLLAWVGQSPRPLRVQFKKRSDAPAPQKMVLGAADLSSSRLSAQPGSHQGGGNNYPGYPAHPTFPSGNGCGGPHSTAQPYPPSSSYAGGGGGASYAGSGGASGLPTGLHPLPPPGHGQPPLAQRVGELPPSGVRRGQRPGTSPIAEALGTAGGLMAKALTEFIDEASKPYTPSVNNQSVAAAYGHNKTHQQQQQQQHPTHHFQHQQHQQQHQHQQGVPLPPWQQQQQQRHPPPPPWRAPAPALQQPYPTTAPFFGGGGVEGGVGGGGGGCQQYPVGGQPMMPMSPTGAVGAQYSFPADIVPPTGTKMTTKVDVGDLTESDEVDITFLPGPLGMRLDERGDWRLLPVSVVTSLVPQGQAALAGVEIGCTVVGVNGERYISHAHAISTLKHGRRPIKLRLRFSDA